MPVLTPPKDPLANAVDGWIAHLEAVRGLSGGTRTRYRRFVQAALGEKDPASIEFADLDRHLGRLWSKGRSTSTIAGAVSALRSFFEYLAMRGEIEVSPARHLRGPRVYEREAPHLTLSEVEKVIFGGAKGRMPSDAFAARDRVLLAVAYVCALRVSEPGELQLEHLELRDGLYSVLIRGAKRSERDVRVTVADPLVSRMLGHFLGQRQEIAEDSRWLFPSRPRRGQSKLSARTVDRIFHDAVASAEIRKKGRDITFHILRHSLATHLHRHGWVAKDVQQWLRHRRLTTTERYLHSGHDELARLWRQKNPLAGRPQKAPDVQAVGRALLAEMRGVLG